MSHFKEDSYLNSLVGIHDSSLAALASLSRGLRIPMDHDISVLLASTAKGQWSLGELKKREARGQMLIRAGFRTGD